MANIPAKNYTVTINSTTNNWANGTLNTKVDPPTYKGQEVWSGYILTTTDVSWTVTLSHGGNNNCVAAFSGGSYNSATNDISGGTVTSGCFEAGSAENPVENRSAEGSGEGVETASSASST